MDEALSVSMPGPSFLLRVRHRMYELLHAPNLDTRGPRVVRMGIAILISLSIASVILESEPSLEASYGRVFYMLEIVTVLLFSIEYLLRLWSIVDDPKYAHPILGRLRYMVTPFALLDLFAVLPFYLPLLIPFDLRFIRVFRLIRIFRVLKMGKYSRSLALLTRVFKAKKEEIAATFFVLLIILIFSGILMYYIEHQAQPQKFSSIPVSLWWAATTLSKVPGDMWPVTPLGKGFAILTAFCGIGVFAVPSAIFVSGLLEEIQHKNGEVILCSRCKEEIARMEMPRNRELERIQESE